MSAVLKESIKDMPIEITSTTDVSNLLKKRREALGMTVLDVSNFIKIRGEHLNFIENDQFDRLPGKVYAIGFVRTYSAYLGLNENLVVERMRLLPEYSETVAIIKAASVPQVEKKVSASAILLAGIFLLLFLAIISHFQESKTETITASSEITKKENTEIESDSQNSLIENEKKDVSFQ